MVAAVKLVNQTVSRKIPQRLLQFRQQQVLKRVPVRRGRKRICDFSHIFNPPVEQITPDSQWVTVQLSAWAEKSYNRRDLIRELTKTLGSRQLVFYYLVDFADSLLSQSVRFESPYSEYLFVRYQPRLAWGDLRHNTDSFVGFLSTATGQPAKISSQEMLDIYEKFQAGRDTFERGHLVKLRYGSYANSLADVLFASQSSLILRVRLGNLNHVLTVNPLWAEKVESLAF